MALNELKSELKLHDTLNPYLWKNNELRPEVKYALLKIAKDFKDYVDVPFRVVDIQIAGSNANFNYSEHSDIDLHLIADFSSVSCDRESHELFDTKRLLYREQHDIKIHGMPVELYVEDSDQPAVSSSYSLLRNKWIKQPSREPVEIDHKELEQTTDLFRRLIQRSTRLANRRLLEKVLKLVRTYRKYGLKHGGEFSIPNLVYKNLRNDSSILGLTQLLDRLHDQELSIKN